VRDPGTGQQHPPDSERDTQRRGEPQGAGGQIAVGIGFAQIDDEEQWQPERADRDQARRQPQKYERRQCQHPKDQDHPEQCPVPRRQLREQRTRQRRPQHMLTRRGAEPLDAQPLRAVPALRDRVHTAQPAERAGRNVDFAYPAVQGGYGLVVGFGSGAHRVAFWRTRMFQTRLSTSGVPSPLTRS